MMRPLRLWLLMNAIMEHHQVLLTGMSADEFVERTAKRTAELIQQNQEKTKVIEDIDANRNVTTEIAGKILHIHPGSVRRKVKKGEIDGSYYGRKILIPMSEIERILKESKINP